MSGTSSGAGGALVIPGDELYARKGTIIFRQGDVGDDMFVIAYGRVRLVLGTTMLAREIALLGPGEFFGELSMVNGGIRTATAEAVEDSALLAIGRDVFAMLVQDDLDIVARMMSTQSHRLMRANLPIEQIGEQLGRIRLVAHSLQQIGVPPRLPWTAKINRLALECHVHPDVAATTIEAITAVGGGTLADGLWTVERAEEVGRVLALLAEFAGDAALSAGSDRPSGE